jgi:sortase A
MDHCGAPPGAADPGALAGVRLEVERLDLLGVDAGRRVLHAAGRAWADRPTRLAAPVLVAGTVRVAAVPGTSSVLAGPGGTRWTADFHVADAVVDAARGWVVEAGLSAPPPAAGPPAGDLVARLQQVVVELRDVDRIARSLEDREGEAAVRATRKRAAEALRAATAAAARAERARERAAAPVLPLADPFLTLAPPAPVVARRGLRPGAGTVGLGLLAATGALLVADAVATVAWQEPVSAALAARERSGLRADFAALEASFGTIAPAPAPQQTATERVAQLAITLRGAARAGVPVARVSVPRIGGSWVVVQGVGAGPLAKGPGHYPTSSLPGRPGTTAFAGHRTTHGAPFRRIDELERGDPIVVRMPYGTFTYRVEGRKIVAPDAVGVLRDVGRPRLVLTACHPRWSARQRIVVSARLDRWTPRGLGARPS